MIRKAASKFLILAAVTLASGAVTVNCSKKSDDDVGSVGFALTLPGSGATISTVNYTISGNGITPIMGSIDVSAPGTTTATALVSGLPAGMYTVSMTAMSSDGQNCTGSTPFTVQAGQTAMANVVLQCTRTRTTGSVAINGRIDQCPFIDGRLGVAAAGSGRRFDQPRGRRVGLGRRRDHVQLDVRSVGMARDRHAGDANTAMTTFTCNVVGTIQLSIAVSDGICGDSLGNVIPVTCTTAVARARAARAAAPPAAAARAAGGTRQAGGTGGGGHGRHGWHGRRRHGRRRHGRRRHGRHGCFSTETSPPAALAASCGRASCAELQPATDGCCGGTDMTGFTLCPRFRLQRPVGQRRRLQQRGRHHELLLRHERRDCDQAGAANGPCVAQMTAAAGRNIATMTTDSPTAAQVVARLGDSNFALGRIVNIEGRGGRLSARRRAGSKTRNALVRSKAEVVRDGRRPHRPAPVSL